MELTLHCRSIRCINGYYRSGSQTPGLILDEIASLQVGGLGGGSDASSHVMLQKTDLSTGLYSWFSLSCHKILKSKPVDERSQEFVML